MVFNTFIKCQVCAQICDSIFTNCYCKALITYFYYLNVLSG